MYNYDNAQIKIIAFISAGSTFNSPSVVWDSGTGNFEWPRADMLVGDFTGDGKADVAAMYDYGSSQTKLLVFAGNGSGGVAPATVAWDSGVGNWEWWRSLPLVGEFTGDSKVDVGAFYNYDNSQTELVLFTSGGSTFTSSVKWDSGPGNWEWGHILVS